ncbi:MAG: ATP-binding protein [Bacteroidota bacterium]
MITIGVILINQFIIQYWLFQKREDANIINMSGRQRMLSQRLIGQSFALLNSSTALSKADLEETFTSWAAAHQVLLNKLQKGFLLFNNQERKLIHLRELDVYIQKARTYLDRIEDLEIADLEPFRLNQEVFLTKMDALVDMLESESNRKLTLIIVIEIIFALISLFMIYYEITYIFRQINEDLSEKNSALIESNQLLEQYAYLAAHDLRSPIQNIINFSKVLSGQLDQRMSEDEKEYLGYVLDSAERMRDTTDDLLQFSSINNNQLNIQPLDPRKLIETVIKDLEYDIKTTGAAISVGPLPGQMEGDRHLLYLVFQNLLSNGMKFVAPDASPRLEVNYQAGENHHLFLIKDNGIGISIEDQQKIFGLFKRLHSKEQYEGTGIGLSICQKIIEKHKGVITLESQPQSGSTFVVQIPKKLLNQPPKSFNE